MIKDESIKSQVNKSLRSIFLQQIRTFDGMVIKCAEGSEAKSHCHLQWKKLDILGLWTEMSPCVILAEEFMVLFDG